MWQTPIITGSDFRRDGCIKSRRRQSSTPTRAATVLTVLLWVVGCAPSREVARNEVGTAVAHEGLNATLWMQQSAEYRAAALQAYGTAGTRLREALSDTSSSAIPSQQQAGMLPPAVILDVDETVLDNSPFQARLVVLDTVYTHGSSRGEPGLFRARLISPGRPMPPA